MADCEYGFYMESSADNSVYHNNFVNNMYHIYTFNSTGVWDNGYSSGGNYWSNYNGTDVNLDGIEDTPCVIDGNNQDRYPFMNQYVIPEFPSTTFILLFMAATLLSVTVFKKKNPSSIKK